LKFPEKKFCSEIRPDGNPDGDPSASVKIFADGSCIYKDFGTGETYNIFSYLIQYFKIKYNEDITYFEVLNIISTDMALNLVDISSQDSVQALYSFREVPYRGGEETIGKSKQIFVEYRDFQWRDDLYWGQYYITRTLLKKFDIYPVQKYFINQVQSYRYRFKNPAYSLESFDKERRKIYLPLSGVWINTLKKEDVDGYHHLPRTGESLLITKSRKDIITSYMFGVPSIAPQGENTYLSLELITELKERFNKIYLLFDNDAPGIKASAVYMDKYKDFIYKDLSIPYDGVCKDISDYIKEYGRESTASLLGLWSLV